VLRAFRQLNRGVHHDRRARRRFGRVNVVDFDADERVRERRHRKRGIDLRKRFQNFEYGKKAFIFPSVNRHFFSISYRILVKNPIAKIRGKLSRKPDRILSLKIHLL